MAGIHKQNVCMLIRQHSVNIPFSSEEKKGAICPQHHLMTAESEPVYVLTASNTEKRSTAEWFKFLIDAYPDEVYLASKTTIGGGFVPSAFKFFGVTMPLGWAKRKLDDYDPISFSTFYQALEDSLRVNIRSLEAQLDVKDSTWTILLS